MLRLPVPGVAFRGHSAPQILLGRRLHPGEVVIAGGDACFVNIYAVDASSIQSQDFLLRGGGQPWIAITIAP